jgi:hypothetical protein
MHLITELAASEFTILSLTEELEEAQGAMEYLKEENNMLVTECDQWQQVWIVKFAVSLPFVLCTLPVHTRSHQTGTLRLY